MSRAHDKYGRGSAAANGAGFVDLEPGDTFDGLEARLRTIKDSVFECRRLGLRASVGSMRNANELAKHLAKEEHEEVHKFAAKNLGVLFSRAGVGIRHLDKKADPKARWVVTYVRVFAWFVFGGERKLATITLKENKSLHNFYSVEALEINEDADSERTPRGAISKDLNSAPLQNLASQLANKITYYVGDVNRTQPSFVASEKPFSVECAASEILKMNGGQTMAGTDISVIILIGQEKIHLKRCIERLAPLDPKCIWLIESQPDDGGVAIAKETAAESGLTVKTVFNKWPGLYAKQFNWALDYVEREVKVKGEGEQRTDWILRLDADEYLTPDTIGKLKTFLCTPTPNSYTSESEVVGLTLELKRRFCGREIRHATNGIRLLRIWRAGHGRSEERAMDEHIEVDGKVIDFDGAFYDDNLNDMDWWRNKHRGYAKREAADALAFARGEIHFKPAKEAYYRMPRYLRALIYFSIRYFLKGGFLDGKAGWMWNFWQGLWYRWIVDREIGRLRRAK